MRRNIPAFGSLTLTSLVSEKQESFGELGVDRDDFQRIGVTGSQEIIECRIEVTDGIVKTCNGVFAHILCFDGDRNVLRRMFCVCGYIRPCRGVEALESHLTAKIAAYILTYRRVTRSMSLLVSRACDYQSGGCSAE